MGIKSKYKMMILRSEKKNWYWKVVHRNGSVLSTSETYSSRSKAVQTGMNMFDCFKRGVCVLEIEEDARKK